VDDAGVVYEDCWCAELACRQFHSLSTSVERGRKAGVVRSTYIFLYLLSRPHHCLSVAYIALVELHARQAFTLLLRVPYVQYSDTGTSHPVRLRQYLAQPARTTRDHHNLLIPVQLPRESIGYARIEEAENPYQRDYGSVDAGGGEVEAVVWRAYRSLAERDEPGDERVEEAAIQDVGEEVDGDVLMPGLGGVVGRHSWVQM